MGAISYNAQRAKDLWRFEDLPESLRSAGSPGSSAFAEAVVALQRELGLPADGKLGPATLAALGLARPEPEAKAEPAASVISTASVWPLTPRFRATRVRKRTAPPRSIVLHDTVTHTAQVAFAVLEKQGYATHFLVDLDGTVHCCMDPGSEWGAHAGPWNPYSVGIDVVAIYDPKLANKSEKGRIVAREWSVSEVVGKVVDYTPEQKVALVQLVRTLCDVLAIPHYVPSAMTSRNAKIEHLRAETYRGVVAHGQVSRSRWDGLLAVEYLLAAGFETE